MANTKTKLPRQFVFILLGIIILQVLLLVKPVVADEACDDLWYSRNFYFDQAGYCFGSKLGNQVFDNSDCKSKNVTLTESIKQRISQMKQVEQEFSCKVDTSKVRPLDIPNFNSRKLLSEQPINHGLESGCYGYLGTNQVPLYSAKSNNSKIMGYVKTGDDICSVHDEIVTDGWWFAGTTDTNGNETAGWTKAPIFDQCETVAG